MAEKRGGVEKGKKESRFPLEKEGKKAATTKKSKQNHSMRKQKRLENLARRNNTVKIALPPRSGKRKH